MGKGQRSGPKDARLQTNKIDQSVKPRAAVSEEYVVNSDSDSGAHDGVNPSQGLDKDLSRSSSSEPDSRTSEDSSSSSDEAVVATPEIHPNANPGARTKDRRQSKGSSRPAVEINGFHAISAQRDFGVDGMLLSPEFLNGKELWHITAPSNVPLSMLKEVSWQAMDEGDKVATHDSIDYAFTKSPGLVPAGNQILLMYPDASGYISAPQAIDKTLHLTRLVPAQIHTSSVQLSPGDNAGTKDTASRTSEQPPGLRMRYWPFGKPKADLQGSGPAASQEMLPIAEPDTATDMVPHPTNGTKRRAKREEDRAASSGRKKHEKKRRAEV